MVLTGEQSDGDSTFKYASFEIVCLYHCKPCHANNKFHGNISHSRIDEFQVNKTFPCTLAQGETALLLERRKASRICFDFHKEGHAIKGYTIKKWREEDKTIEDIDHRKGIAYEEANVINKFEKSSLALRF